MPRARSTERPSRAKKPLDIPPVLVRRPTLARALDVTEGFIRALNSRGDGPIPIRVGKVVLYDLAESITWFKRNATRAA